MKDKNLPNDYSDLSLEELTNEANKMIEYLENQKDLENSMENYQNLIKLNNIIEKKFQRNIKDIKQTFKLTSSIRKVFKDKRYPILVDQEGGRVNRLKNIAKDTDFILKGFIKKQ